MPLRALALVLGARQKPDTEMIREPPRHVHGDYELAEPENHKEIGMDPKMNNLIASGLAFAGAVAIYFGFADEATWAKLAGGMSTLMAVLMPWLLKPKSDAA